MFDNNIREVRKKFDMTQQELADYLGVTKSSVCLYEMGKRVPTVMLLKDMSRIFNVSVDYLINNNIKEKDE